MKVLGIERGVEGYMCDNKSIEPWVERGNEKLMP